MTDSIDPSDETVIVPASATWYVTDSLPPMVADGVDVVGELDVVLDVDVVVRVAAIPTPTAMSTAMMLAIDIVEILLNMFMPPVWQMS
ncbi:MAG: hypothetical protein M3092_00115 [Actinomycetia bacterium]|nr:hypothetical protein [Actinomycetes bacterium]